MSDFNSMREVIKHLADGGTVQLSKCKSVLKLDEDGWRLGALYNIGDLSGMLLTEINKYIEPIKYSVEIFTNILPTGPAFGASAFQEFLLDRVKWNDRRSDACQIKLRITVEEII